MLTLRLWMTDRETTARGSFERGCDFVEVPADEQVV